MSAYYRDVVLPALNPDPASGCPPELAVRAPQLLANLYFAFARLFDLAARWGAAEEGGSGLWIGRQMKSSRRADRGHGGKRQCALLGVGVGSKGF